MTKYIAKTAFLTVLLMSTVSVQSFAAVGTRGESVPKNPYYNPIPGSTPTATTEESDPAAPKVDVKTDTLKEYSDPIIVTAKDVIAGLKPGTPPPTDKMPLAGIAGIMGVSKSKPVDFSGKAGTALDMQLPGVLASGRVNPEECTISVLKAQAIHEAVSQKQVEKLTEVAKLPSAGAISCSSLNQARIANVAIDLLKSNGVQSKMFGILGGDANSIMGAVGITNGLAQTVGTALLASIKITGLGPLEGILGGGPINVSARDCKLMEKLSKPQCIIGPNSIIAQKGGDGTASNCMDNQVVAGILSAVSGDKSGLKELGGNVVGNVFNDIVSGPSTKTTKTINPDGSTTIQTINTRTGGSVITTKSGTITDVPPGGGT